MSHAVTVAEKAYGKKYIAFENCPLNFKKIYA